MIIFLKTLGFGIWLVIMLVLIAAVRRTSHPHIRRISMGAGGPDDAHSG